MGIARSLGRGGVAEVESVASLSSIDDVPYADGSIACVVGWPGEPVWQLKRSSARASDGVTFQATKSGNGVWERITTIATGGIPTAQQQPTWKIDIAGSFGGNDQNDGEINPIATTDEMVRRWATREPRLRQSTTINFVSSCSDNSGPIYLRPFIENGSQFLVTGQRTVVQSGTLSGVVSKNKLVGQLLNAVLGSGLSAGLVIANTTHPSEAKLYKNLSGTTWAITQPLGVPTVPFTEPTEVDTWADGDNYVVYSLPYVNLVELATRFTDSALSPNNIPIVSNIRIFDPNSAIGLPGTNAFYGLNQGVWYQTVSFDRCMVISGTQNPLFSGGAFNCDWAGGINTTDTNAFNVSLEVHGGMMLPGPLSFYGLTGIKLASQSDVILAANINLNTVSIETVNQAYIENGKTLNVVGSGNCQTGTGATLWGPGALNVGGTVRFSYPSGIGQAEAIFLMTGGFTLNGATGCLLSTRGNALVAGKTLSAAALDADLGATLGAYLNPGGASITNEAS